MKTNLLQNLEPYKEKKNNPAFSFWLAQVQNTKSKKRDQKKEVADDERVSRAVIYVQSQRARMDKKKSEGKKERRDINAFVI